MQPDSLRTRERRRTVPGLVRLIYNNQRMTSRRAGRALPTYSYEQLLDWVQQQPNFHRLYGA